MRKIVIILLCTIFISTPVQATTLDINANVTGDYLGTIFDSLEEYPAALRDSVETLGWHIVVTDSNLSEYAPIYYDKTLYGLTDGNIQRMFISTNIPDMDTLRHVTLHEYAHIIDFIYKQGDSDFVQQEMVSSAAKFPTINSAITSQSEFYAECWAYYFTDPEFLQTVSPVMYTHVDTILSQW